MLLYNDNMPKFKIFIYPRIINVISAIFFISYLLLVFGDMLNINLSNNLYSKLGFIWLILYVPSLVLTIVGTIIHRRTLTAPENYGEFKKFLAITFLPLGLCVIGAIGALLWLSIELSGVSGA